MMDRNQNGADVSRSKKGVVFAGAATNANEATTQNGQSSSSLGGSRASRSKTDRHSRKLKANSLWHKSAATGVSRPNIRRSTDNGGEPQFFINGGVYAEGSTAAAAEIQAIVFIIGAIGGGILLDALLLAQD